MLITQQFLLTYRYTHRLMLLSTVIWEAFICISWWLTQRPTTAQGIENERLKNPQPYMEDIYCTPFLKSRDHWRRGGVKSVGAKESRGLQGRTVFLAWQGSCTYELTTVVTSHTRSVKIQARSNRNTERELDMKSQPLALEIGHEVPPLLSIGDCGNCCQLPGEGEIIFFKQSGTGTWQRVRKSEKARAV